MCLFRLTAAGGGGGGGVRIRCKMTGTASALTAFTLYLKINSAGQAKWECDL